MEAGKTGKFIAELRKNKNLTQEKLGELIGINPKTVSKWERGISFPDSSILRELSNALEVSVIEILNGERLSKEDKKAKENKLTIDGINLYKKRIKNKYSKFLFICIFSFILCILSLFVLNNYNKCKIYSISSLDENVTLDGYVIFNPYKKIILINDIVYTDINTGTDKEILIKKINISLINGKKTIFLENEIRENSEAIPISEYLKKYNINFSETVSDKNEMIKTNELEDLYLLIDYYDDFDNHSSIKVEIKITEEFRNNKIIY